MYTDKGKNINNAFAVVFETYKNVNKLMEKIIAFAGEEREMYLSSNQFIRYKSDPNISGWAVSYFMLPFRRPIDKDTIYLVEIIFDYEFDHEKDNKGPQIGLSKLSYRDLPDDVFLSAGDYWFFTAPLYDEKFVQYNQNDEGTRFISKKINKERADYKHYGLNSIKSIYIPLVDVNSANIEEKIFNTFDELDSM